jgi:hypothetical protein
MAADTEVPGLIPGATSFWEVVGLELGGLSFVSTTGELLEWKSSGSGLENREYDHGDPLGHGDCLFLFVLYPFISFGWCNH